jgi:hypothetical protein
LKVIVVDYIPLVPLGVSGQMIGKTTALVPSLPERWVENMDAKR